MLLYSHSNVYILSSVSRALVAKMTTPILNWDAIANESRGLFDPTQTEVFTKLRQALSAETGTADEVKQFVAFVSSYSPQRLEEAGLSPEDLVWNTWRVFTYTAARIPPDHPAQHGLVQVLLALEASDAPWKGLPDFGMFMRDEWNKCKRDLPTYGANSRLLPWWLHASLKIK